MAKKSTAKVQIPEVRDPAAEIATAAQRAAQQAIDHALISGRSRITEADLEWNDPAAEVIKGTQYASDIWIHGPAQIQLLSIAYGRLIRTSPTPVTKVVKVRIARVKGKKEIIIKPTHADDPMGIAVKFDDYSAWINAISVLSPARLTVRSGYRDRFVAEYAPDDYPGAPALLINLAARVERVFEGTKKKSDEAAAASNSTRGAKSKTAGKGGRGQAAATAPDAPDSDESTAS